MSLNLDYTLESPGKLKTPDSQATPRPITSESLGVGFGHQQETDEKMLSVWPSDLEIMEVEIINRVSRPGAREQCSAISLILASTRFRRARP